MAIKIGQELQTGLQYIDPQNIQRARNRSAKSNGPAVDLPDQPIYGPSVDPQ